MGTTQIRYSSVLAKPFPFAFERIDEPGDVFAQCPPNPPFEMQSSLEGSVPTDTTSSRAVPAHSSNADGSVGSPSQYSRSTSRGTIRRNASSSANSPAATAFSESG